MSTIPASVLATDKQRLDVEATARASVVAEQRAVVAGAGAQGSGLFASPAFTNVGFGPPLEPLSDTIRRQALQQVDKQLVAAKLLDKVDGKVSTEAQKEFSFEIRSSLPTPGVLVRGCLDECDICEPTLEREIELDLERKRLENERLKREIELMDKDQQHRCCAAGSEPEA